MLHDVVSATLVGECRGDHKTELAFDDGERGVVGFSK